MTDTDLKICGATEGKVLKDLDYVRIKAMRKFFNMSQTDIDEIMKTLQCDIDFL